MNLRISGEVVAMHPEEEVSIAGIIARLRFHLRWDKTPNEERAKLFSNTPVGRLLVGTDVELSYDKKRPGVIFYSAQNNSRDREPLSDEEIIFLKMKFGGEISEVD